MYQQRFPLREVEHHRDQRHQSTGSERVVCEVGGVGEAHLEVTPVEREENTNDKKYSVDTPRHPAGLLGPDQSTLDLPRASKIIQERRFFKFCFIDIIISFSPYISSCLATRHKTGF